MINLIKNNVDQITLMFVAAATIIISLKINIEIEVNQRA